MCSISRYKLKKVKENVLQVLDTSERFSILLIFLAKWRNGPLNTFLSFNTYVANNRDFSFTFFPNKNMIT